MLLAIALLGVPSVVQIKVDPARVLNSFVPQASIGADIDGHGDGDSERLFQPANAAAMISSGIRSVSYRLRTELGVEAWHWNPTGKWSDPDNRQGYWTSSTKPGPPIRASYGYRLPRRGNTFDQANNDGYSRIDDGDPATYWKSNPYLDPAYSKDATMTGHQWVVVDLKHSVDVDTARVAWANPYARRYRLEFYVKGDDDKRGEWRTVPNGDVSNGQGGIETIRFPDLHARFFRMALLESSHTAEPDSIRDPRDAMGYAIRELDLGQTTDKGFQDAVIHEPDQKQTAIYTSSTDPWHRDVDRDPNVEQPGFDLLESSGIASSRPMLVPLPLLYDTPENAVAEVRWLRDRKVPIRGFELGEEPDGQYADAGDYGSLYASLARRLGPLTRVPIGGPGLQSVDGSSHAWPDPNRPNWMTAFLSRLRDERALSQLQFVSFEWYPCDDLKKSDEELLQSASASLSAAVTGLRGAGLPAGVPWMITEFGYSSFARPAEDDLAGALLNLDVVGKSLTLGSTAVFEYGYEPGKPINERPGEWGNMMQWLADDRGRAAYPTSTYWATKLMLEDWCLPEPGPHLLLATESSDPRVAAYTVRRPDHTISILLLNESAEESFPIALDIGGRPASPVRLVRWGGEQYCWRPTGAEGCPVKTLPPVAVEPAETTILPPFSTTVIQLGRQK